MISFIRVGILYCTGVTLILSLCLSVSLSLCLSVSVSVSVSVCLPGLSLSL
eukprot:COSAG03_NODE_5943_length_1144_cov_1.658373_1_plen_50_part_10